MLKIFCAGKFLKLHAQVHVVIFLYFEHWSVYGGLKNVKNLRKVGFTFKRHGYNCPENTQLGPTTGRLENVTKRILCTAHIFIHETT